MVWQKQLAVHQRSVSLHNWCWKAADDTYCISCATPLPHCLWFLLTKQVYPLWLRLRSGYALSLAFFSVTIFISQSSGCLPTPRTPRSHVWTTEEPSSSYPWMTSLSNNRNVHFRPYCASEILDLYDKAAIMNLIHMIFKLEVSFSCSKFQN